jgi:hypothetical protein
MAAVVLGNAVGLAASIAAAVSFQSSAQAFSAASEGYSTDSTNAADSLRSSAFDDVQRALSIASVQAFCEVAVLLLIVVAFTTSGLMCARRISSMVSTLDAASPMMAVQHQMRQQVVNVAITLGHKLQREVIFTTVFVFVAFLLRSTVSTMLALAFQLQDTAAVCPGSTSAFPFCNASCYNVFSHITLWNSYTPQFQPVVVLLSSPLTLLIALCAMTSARTRQLMTPQRRVG